MPAILDRESILLTSPTGSGKTLAGFLGILFDPLVVLLEKLHLPRGVAAAGVVLAGMGLIGLLG